MKSLQEFILESSDSIDRTFPSNIREIIKRMIYKRVNKLKLTSKPYRDDAWQGVNDIREAITDAIEEDYKTKYKDKHNEADYDYEVIVYPENGGYRRNSSGDQWKEYKVEIGIKDRHDPFIRGILNCHAAGSMNDPFDAYDMSLTI